MTNDVEQYKKIVKSKNKEIERLKKTLEQLKQDYLQAMQNKTDQSSMVIDPLQAEHSLKTAQFTLLI